MTGCTSKGAEVTSDDCNRVPILHPEVSRVNVDKYTTPGDSDNVRHIFTDHVTKPRPPIGQQTVTRRPARALIGPESLGTVYKGGKLSRGQ